MRIAFTHTNAQLNSLAVVLKHSEFDVIFWLNKNKPTFDMFNELKPNLIITTPNYVDNAMMECLDEYKETMVVSLGNDSTNPLLTRTIVCLLATLKSKISLPDNFLQIEPFADITTFYPGKHNDKSASDIVCLDMTQEEIAPMDNAGFQVKAFGRPLKSPYYLGPVSPAKSREIFSSAKVGFHPIVENVVASKCFALSSIEKEEIESYSSDEDMVEKLNKFIKNDKLRTKSTKHTFNYVMSKHTCFHRMASIFKKLDMETESDKVMETFKNYASRYTN